MAQQESSDVVATINQVRNDFNLLQIRLDTSNILEQAKLFLNSEAEIIKEDGEGKLLHQVVKLGPPKANKRGTAGILNWLQMIVNPQVVQGNFPVTKGGESPMYNMFIEECQKDFGDFLMVNLYNYDIDDDEIQGIIDGIMNLIKAFMTRLIGDRERASYGQTFKTIESNRSSFGPSQGINPFRR